MMLESLFDKQNSNLKFLWNQMFAKRDAEIQKMVDIDALASIQCSKERR